MKFGLSQILVVDDDHVDAGRLIATLRVVFGYETRIGFATTIADAVDFVVGGKPAIVFLDDILKPSTDATRAIPLLRAAGYAGPIVVVSGEVTHARRAGLLAAGASDVIHKDDVDSVRITEALLRLGEAGTEAAAAQPQR